MTDNAKPDRASFIATVKAAIDADRQNTRKWQKLYDWFEQQFGIKGGSGGAVGAKLLTEDKQLSNRIRKELAELNPEYAVLCALKDVSMDDVRRWLRDAILPRLKTVVIFRETAPKHILVADEGDAVTDTPPSDLTPRS